MAMPSLASSSMVLSVVTHPVPTGPTAIPTPMNATMSGWRSRMASPPTTVAIARIMALLTLLWVVLSGESWWSTAEAEHGQGDQGFGTA
ncbi:MAG: hypothetical protein QG597_5139, partial [Actinomycetota bacterium]|nr:hypothetical protein [Actinomycetota bacterium]